MSKVDQIGVMAVVTLIHLAPCSVNQKEGWMRSLIAPEWILVDERRTSSIYLM